MKDPTSKLRTATRRAKSDVANKLVSMFLHELSRTTSKNSPVKVESEVYAENVRTVFGNLCPYCNMDLLTTIPMVEHLDGMNRYRVGLHIAGNVLVACKRCNNEKRRDDSAPQLVLAASGWESFLSHDGRCGAVCPTCKYWASIWPSESGRAEHLAANLHRIRIFRSQFTDLEPLRNQIAYMLPDLLGKLYSDCQKFAETEITQLLQFFAKGLPAEPVGNTSFSAEVISVQE